MQHIEVPGRLLEKIPKKPYIGDLNIKLSSDNSIVHYVTADYKVKKLKFVSFYRILWTFRELHPAKKTRYNRNKTVSLYSLDRKTNRCENFSTIDGTSCQQRVEEKNEISD